jgi:hypothetical protein
MSVDGFDLDLDTYPGVATNASFDRVPCLRFTPPAGSRYARFVTRRRFLPGLKVAGWFALNKWSDHEGPYDGIHLHVGHVGNGRNYVASVLRRDGHSKVAVEYGWKGYTTLAALWGTGPAFVYQRVYHWEITWERDRIRTWVGNEVGAWEMDAPIPAGRVIPYGSVGFRLDNVDAFGHYAVKEHP